MSWPLERLSETTADRLDPAVARFGYDRARQKVGIVHLGIGAFHRAHQAWYTDRAMDAAAGSRDGRDWMITGVSLRSGNVAEQMNPQSGLYTVTEHSETASATRLIGSVQEVLVAPRAAAAVTASVAAPTTRIVSLTITEKGYCRTADGSLDHALAQSGTIYPVLAEAFRQRREAGIAGLTLLSCDNLADNGAQLRRLTLDYLSRHAPHLGNWFETECTCPSTMVDRIVPATTDADRDALAACIGLRDEASVMTEPFSQWVIEDRFAGPRPRWEAVGAQVVEDVAPFETAKLRMLNGAHSALAYLGLERGHDFVHQAIADARIRPLVERLLREEAATSFAPAAGQDLNRYADELIARFANSALNHRLIQIAMDGSQKIPQRWLETLAIHQRGGRACPAIMTALAAWIRHVRGDLRTVDDPLAGELAALWRKRGHDHIAAGLFGPEGLFAGSWSGEPGALSALSAAIRDKCGYH